MENAPSAIGILATGNELLTGKTLDTNSRFLAKALQENGITVHRVLLCNDDRTALLDCLDYLFARVNTVVMTGGLGPTSDDLTAVVVAEYFGKSTRFYSEAWEHCVSMFAKLGRKEVPESNRKQAYLPEGSEILPNPFGTAVGFAVSGSRSGDGEEGAKRLEIFCLPGVPHEMEPMFKTEVLPRIPRAEWPVVSAVWQCFALGESAMQTRLSAFEAQLPRRVPDGFLPSVSYQAHAGYVTYTLRLAAVKDGDVNPGKVFLRDEACDAVSAALHPHVLYQSEESLVPFLLRLMTERNLTLSLAESCTGGLVAKEICAVPGASQTFLGGVVAYANQVKVKTLGVKEQTLADFGAASAEVAAEMAEGSVARFSSDTALSITGVAGPDGGTPHHPVGHVCFAFSVHSHRIADETALGNSLGRFGWQCATTQGSGEEGKHGQPALRTFTCVRFFGGVVKRDVIQSRASVFALGSLIAAALHLR